MLRVGRPVLVTVDVSRANRKLRFSRVRQFSFVLITARVQSSLGYHT